MTAPVSSMLVSTVAPRPRPAPKGEGRPVGTPLTVLEGVPDVRGASAAGLPPARTWLVVVELEDVDGVVGVGTAGFGNPAAIEVLRQLEPFVVGRAPSEVAHVWESMYRATLNVGRRGLVLHAISAIDIALWDLFGKQLGVPVYELLGGKLRASLPAYAIRCIQAIEDDGIRLRWLEEPVIPDDVAGLARVRAAVTTPIAAGEHEATRYGFRDLVVAGAVDVLQPDVNRLGGITEARRVWALGETFGLDVVPHLGFAHNAHLAISSLSSPLLEYMPPPRTAEEADEDQIFWVAFPNEPRAENGQVTLSGTPGLGVNLDRTAIERAL